MWDDPDDYANLVNINLQKELKKFRKKNKKLEKQVKKLTFVILNTKEDKIDTLLSKHDKLRMKRKKK